MQPELVILVDVAGRWTFLTTELHSHTSSFNSNRFTQSCNVLNF